MPEPRNGSRPEPTASPAAERRAFVRYVSNLEASCRSSSPLRDAGRLAKVHNVSAGGLGLVMRHPFRTGTPVVVEVKGRDGKLLGVFEARVAHATAVLEDGQPCWLVGCAFSRVLTEEELQALR